MSRSAVLVALGAAAVFIDVAWSLGELHFLCLIILLALTFRPIVIDTHLFHFAGENARSFIDIFFVL